MTAEALTIRELSGSMREVELRDRALPHRPVAWPGELSHVQKWYPGNPVATIQVLGPRCLDTSMGGVWKTRYIGQMVHLVGFDDLVSEGDDVTAELLVQVFHRLLRAGNPLEVAWGPEVRRGILSKFEPNYERVEDVEWSVTFVWNQLGELTAPRVAAASSPQRDLDAALSELEDALARMPAIILPNLTGAIIFAEQAMRDGALALSAGLGAIYGVPEVTLAEFGGIASAAEMVATASRSALALALDSSPEDVFATDDVTSALAAETWRRDFGAAARHLGALAIKAREAVRARVVDDYLAIETIGPGQTLRSLALRYYGSADSWPLIADANGLVGSDAPVGTRVVIPRRSGAA
jgi:hypothetical protein